MSTMQILRPIIRRIVMDGEEGMILAEQWARSMPDESDVTADNILLTVAEFINERNEIELLKARPEAGGD